MNTKRHTNIHLKDNRGYTLLFSVLVASLILGVGISILNISRKEFLMATSTRDSSLAFYAADGGLECAILNDSNGVFVSANQGSAFASKFMCAVSHNELDYRETVFGSVVTERFVYHAKFGGEGTSCAVTVVERTTVDEDVSTVIESYGYNTGWDEGNQTCTRGSAKRVERALRYTTS